MNKEVAAYKEEVFSLKQKEYIQNCHQYLLDNKESLSTDFIGKIVKTMKENMLTEEWFSLINISPMYISLCNGIDSFTCLIEGFMPNGVKPVFSMELHIGWLLNGWQEYKADLLSAVDNRVQYVKDTEIDALCWETVNIMVMVWAQHLRYWFRDKRSSFIELIDEKDFMICMGRYGGSMEPVFYIKEGVPLEEHKSQVDFSYMLFKNYSEHFVNVNGKNLANTMFVGCRFEKCNFQGCDMSDVIFKVCSFLECTFSGNFIGGVEFEKCYFYSVEFTGSTVEGKDDNIYRKPRGNGCRFVAMVKEPEANLIEWNGSK